MADVIRRRVVVSGRVQGVWFRESCRREADGRSVSGWVRNRPDGTVEAEFEGERAAVMAMIDWCRAGPPRAEVTGLSVSDGQPTGDAAFVVR